MGVLSLDGLLELEMPVHIPCSIRIFFPYYNTWKKMEHLPIARDTNLHWMMTLSIRLCTYFSLDGIAFLSRSEFGRVHFDTSLIDHIFEELF